MEVGRRRSRRPAHLVSLARGCRHRNRGVQALSRVGFSARRATVGRFGDSVGQSAKSLSGQEGDMQPFRVLALIVAAISAAILAAPTQAAEYPERTITVIVPFPPRGAPHATARLVT